MSVPRHFFGNTIIQVQLVVLVSVLLSFLFAVLLLTMLSRAQAPAVCKSGGTCPPCPMESAPQISTNSYRSDSEKHTHILIVHKLLPLHAGRQYHVYGILRYLTVWRSSRLCPRSFALYNVYNSSQYSHFISLFISPPLC